MSIRRLYDEHKEVIARSKIEKRGVGRPSWVRQKGGQGQYPCTQSIQFFAPFMVKSETSLTIPYFKGHKNFTIGCKAGPYYDGGCIVIM